MKVLNIFLRNHKGQELGCKTHAHKWDHVLSLLRTLHWLPIQQAHIEYKLPTPFFSESDTAPVYLSDLLHVYPPSWLLWPLLLWLRNVRHSAYSDQTSYTLLFFYAAPSVWNSLPSEIRRIQFTTAFNSTLKTHPFKEALSQLVLFTSSLFIKLTVSPM